MEDAWRLGETPSATGYVSDSSSGSSTVPAAGTWFAGEASSSTGYDSDSSSDSSTVPAGDFPSASDFFEGWEVDESSESRSDSVGGENGSMSANMPDGVAPGSGAHGGFDAVDFYEGGDWASASYAEEDDSSESGSVVAPFGYGDFDDVSSSSACEYEEEPPPAARGVGSGEHCWSYTASEDDLASHVSGSEKWSTSESDSEADERGISSGESSSGSDHTVLTPWMTGSQMAEDRELDGPPPAATAQRGAAGGFNMSKARAHNRPRPGAVACSSPPQGPVRSILQTALKRKLTWPECERRNALFHAAPPTPPTHPPQPPQR